jgi:DNA-binding IclR family transcriptional regulator
MKSNAKPCINADIFLDYVQAAFLPHLAELRRIERNLTYGEFFRHLDLNLSGSLRLLQEVSHVDFVQREEAEGKGKFSRAVVD